MCPAARETGISTGWVIHVFIHRSTTAFAAQPSRINPIPIPTFQGTRRPITLFRHQRVVCFDVPEVTSARSGGTQRAPPESGRVRTFASKNGFRHPQTDVSEITSGVLLGRYNFWFVGLLLLTISVLITGGAIS